MSSIAIIYHSGYGHTEVVAHHVARGVTEGGGTPVLLKVENAAQDFAPLLSAASAADAIVFGSPTYMGTVSAPMKAFMEATSQIWMSGGWKDKIGAAFTNSGSLSGDKLNTLVTLAVFGAQHAMLWAGLAEPPLHPAAGEAGDDRVNRLGSFLGAMAQSADAGPDETPPEGDLATARSLGSRVAAVTARWTSPA